MNVYNYTFSMHIMQALFLYIFLRFHIKRLYIMQNNPKIRHFFCNFPIDFLFGMMYIVNSEISVDIFE